MRVGNLFTKKNIDEKGISVLEIVLIIVIVGLVGFTGWYVWQSQQVAVKNDKQSVSDSNPPGTKSVVINSYESCLKESGSKIQETYPQICVTKDGKQFTQDVNEGAKTANYLIIKEWGIKIPLSVDTADAYYTRADNNMVHISTHKLHAIYLRISGCRPGVDDLYLARSTDTGTTTDTWRVHIGNYYYFRGGVIEPQCISQDQSNYANQYEPIQDSLNKDMQQLISE